MFVFINTFDQSLNTNIHLFDPYENVKQSPIYSNLVCSLHIKMLQISMCDASVEGYTPRVVFQRVGGDEQQITLAHP